MKKISLVIGSLLLASMALAVTPVKSVSFTYPKDGDTVPLKFKAKFGATGIPLKPAGQQPIDKNSGHLHIIIDGKAAAEGAVVPADATHIHFGKAQTEGEITLTPGAHTLVLQLADGLHRGFGADLTQEIHITAK